MSLLVEPAQAHAAASRDTRELDAEAVAFVVGQPETDELFPGVFDLADLSHIGHGAAGIEVGEHDRLSGMGQDVGAFRHEVDSAEDDVLTCGLGRQLREPVRIAAIVGKTNDFIALIVMPQDHTFASQRLFRGCDALVHRMVGKHEIVFERAGCCFSNRCCCHVMSLPSVPAAILRDDARTGMLKALSPAPADAHTTKAPPAGMLKPQFLTTVNDA